MKCLIFLIFCGFTVANIYQQTLIRMESKKSKMMKEGTWKEYYKNKKIAQYFAFELNDFDEAEYVANLTLGTPGQSFLFLIDPNCGSCSWIPNISCGEGEYCARFCESIGESCTIFCHNSCCSSLSTTDTTEVSACSKKSKFNSTMSSTFNSTADLTCDNDFNLGYIKAENGAEDFIHFGDPNKEQLSINVNGFCLADDISPSFADTPFDGIFDMNVFWPNSVDTSLLDKNIFTIYFYDHGNQYNISAGLITYGELDKEHCNSNIEYYWRYQWASDSYYFHINSVTFGSNNYSNGGDAVLDITRSSILVPKKVYDEITKTISLDENGFMSCNASIDDFIFNIVNKNYTIPSKNLIHQIADDKCILAIESLPTNTNDTISQLFDFEKLWIFGTPLFHSYCTVFGVNVYGENEFGLAEII